MNHRNKELNTRLARFHKIGHFPDKATLILN